MFRKIIKRLRLRQILQQKAKEKGRIIHRKSDKLSRQLEDNLTLFKNILGQNSDLLFVSLVSGEREKLKLPLFFSMVLSIKKLSTKVLLNH